MHDVPDRDVEVGLPVEPAGRSAGAQEGAADGAVAAVAGQRTGQPGVAFEDGDAERVGEGFGAHLCREGKGGTGGGSNCRNDSWYGDS